MQNGQNHFSIQLFAAWSVGQQGSKTLDGLTTLSQGKGLGYRLVVAVVVVVMVLGFKAGGSNRVCHTAYFDIFCKGEYFRKRVNQFFFSH